MGINDLTANNKALKMMGSEQSQKIKALTSQVEKLKERCISYAGEVDQLNRKYIDDTRYLREERKELVEALRGRYEHLKWLKEVNTTPPAIIDEISFLQSLLSKFEVHKQNKQ